MCLVSDTIQFCTCNNDSVDNLKHYWILNRYNKNKNCFTIGTSIIPSKMMDANFSVNNQQLCDRLNEPDAFDVPIRFKTKDAIEIVINNHLDDLKRFTYTFEFKKGKWRIADHDPFYLMDNYDEEKKGKIKNALISDK